MLGKLLDFVGGGIVKSADGLVKTVFGSKEQRDTAAHAEQMSVMGAFAAEFHQRNNRTWWDSTVDGLNRLPRPAMTFGIIYLFWYCMHDPAGFGTSMAALALMPDYGWAVISTVIAFWFGGKFLSKDARKVVPPDPEAMIKVIEAMERLEDKRAQMQPPSPPSG